jgi:ribosomal protein L21
MKKGPGANGERKRKLRKAKERKRKELLKSKGYRKLYGKGAKIIAK